MDYGKQIIPVLVGTDINVYGMARSFHEEYGIKSHCIGVSELIMTKNSKICDVTIVSNLKDNEVFVKSLIELSTSITNSLDIKPILICAGDEYTELVIKNEKKLSEYFLIPYPNQSILSKVYYKDSFYALCEEYGLPYPQTVVVGADDYEQQVNNLSLKFPVAMKPVDAAQQIALNFEGQRKAYKFENKDDIINMIKKTYDAGYIGKFLLQDFIPGDDTHMYTINFYADADHNVRMMTMGQQLLQDPSDFLVGNYIATMIKYVPEIEQKLTNFIKEIEYSGYGNFDLKFDDRDQEYKLIELNPRQGRSSFYTTASGYNLVKYAVEDLIFNEPYIKTVYADTDFLWVGVNVDDALKHVSDPEIKQKMEELVAQGKYGDTLRYKKDRSITRNRRVNKYYASYKNRF
ncbi:D-aspartate ligase [Companilactobacillus sp. RD055328]|uniref:carboxylate--amine ligase n=1 Tax=Companilactobacillus sp. RD055328 TaxID=2916634 RepID=UPI001FC83EE7|nr:carboxylate--amine ligase [Companilactobacillus sp. RD055328]GKQ42542.1 D-aspartate ligase [Companilactobacillus sp. RD055328]